MSMKHPQNPPLAAGLTLAASALVALTMLLAKALGTDVLGPALHPLQVSHGRFLFALLTIAGFAAIYRPHWTKPNLKIHFTRSACGWGGVSLMFAAATFIPLSDATAISFLNPVFGMFLAVLVLGEQVGFIRFLAAFVALLGALILARPGSGALELGALLALASALLFGAEIIAIKLLSSQEHPVQILLINNTIGVVIATISVSFVWQPPTASQWLGLIAIGAVMVCAQACFVNAMSRADASFVAPFFFAALVFATFYDAVAFQVLPDTTSFIGAGVIIAGAGLLAWREGMKRKQ